MTSIRTILQQAAHDLNISGSSSPRLDAELLLMHLLKIDHLLLFTHPERELIEEEAAAFAQVVSRRCSGEPLAYITGEKEFWSLRFEVNREVLIPRPETECLIEELLRFYDPPGAGLQILDIGTGSGAIGIVLARELPEARVVATDISAEALSVSRRNAMANGVADRVDFIQGDLLAAVSGIYDIICSNPPYIPDVQYGLLPPGIRDFEPRGALFAGPDGLDFYRRVIREGVSRLKAGGRIFLEIGEGQRNKVEALFRQECGYRDIDCRKDYGGMDRVVSARKED
ncbi:MAG: peptide chain release factor N(5)-glutamine methyltransferase [Deltaproteobacteria bacterium]